MTHRPPAQAMNAVPEAIPANLLMDIREHLPGNEERPSHLFWRRLRDALKQPERECLPRLGKTLSMPILSRDALFERQPDFKVFSFAQCKRAGVLVLQAAPGACAIVATSDPFDTSLQTRLDALLERHAGPPAAGAQWHLALPHDIDDYLSQQETRLYAMDRAVADMQGDLVQHTAPVDQLSLASIDQDSSPVVRLVSSILFDAMKAQASDIHIETDIHGLHIKYRIDGVLSSAAQIAGRNTATQVISRIKVMAELDIAEQRVPQDGRFKLAVREREIDFRVSVMPSLYGEDIVIRVLDKHALTNQVQELRLDYLGFQGQTLAQLRQLAGEPYGMLLVTGPTGSGKTTTLYAALTEINSGEVKIVTIEDPIEYELPGILQIPVNEKKGMGFARGLRSVLRHDPDKIFVGEIRDSETAQIAIQSALTGHLVFTSVHANNVFDVLGRFLHLGVDTYSFVSALNGVLAQRLIRVICPHCKEAVDEHSDEHQQWMAAIQSSSQAIQGLPYRGRGCTHCRGTGYKGRRAISEVLLMDDELREMIIARAPIRTLKSVAQQKGAVFLRDAALKAVAQGWTSLQEINRVTFAQA